VLLPLAVLQGIRYILAEEESILDAAADMADQSPHGVSFVPPLDALVWDRLLLRELWGLRLHVGDLRPGG
jgi:hypothetical protein